MPPPDPRNAWKHAGSARAPGSPPPAPGAAPPGGSRGAVLVTLLGVLALAGATAGMFLYLGAPPKTRFVALAVSEYADRALPVNAFAQRDAAALAPLFASTAGDAIERQEAVKFREELDALSRREDGGATAVYVNALARVDDKGEVLILTQEHLAAGGPDSFAIPLRDVLTALRRAQGDRLLLLDIARPLADARLGGLGDDPAGAAVALLAGEDWGFPALVAAGPGEISLGLPAVGRSRFGLTLERGLRGDADGWAGDAPDRVVSMRELAAFARHAVAAGLREPEVQSPRLVARGEAARDFPIRTITPGDGAVVEELPTEGTHVYPPDLLAAWRALEPATDDASPARLRRAATLVRIETRWRLWEALTHERIRLELDDPLFRSTPPAPPADAPRALRHTLSAIPAASQAAARKLESDLRRAAAAPEVKPEPFRALAEAAADDAAFAPVASAVAWGELCRLESPTFAHLEAFDAFARAFSASARYPEWALVEYAARLPAGQRRKWEDADRELTPAKLIRELLRTCDRLESAVPEPTAFPWARESLAAAEGKFQDGLMYAALGGVERHETAEGLATLRACAAECEPIAERVRAAASAARQLEEAAGTLAALAHAPAVAPLPLVPGTRWDALLRATRELDAALAVTDKGKPGEADPVALGRRRDEARAALDALRRAVGTDALSFMRSNTSADRGGEWAAWEAAFAYPGWPPEERVKLSDAWAKAIREDYAKRLAAPRVRPPEDAWLTVSEEPPPAAPRPADVVRARASVGRALEWLRFAAPEDAAPAAELWPDLSRADEPARWKPALAALSKQWRTALPARYRDAAASPALARLALAVHPADWERVTGGSAPPDPRSVLRSQRSSDYSRHLADARYGALARQIGRDWTENASADAIRNREAEAALKQRYQDFSNRHRTASRPGP